MRKLFISALGLIYCSLTWALNGISIIQSSIGNGLESQSLNVLAKDRQRRLWIGSDVGLSLISNGTVINIRDIVSEGGLVMLGNVNSIICTETVLLACEDRILHYDHKKGFARTLRYEDRILHTEYLLLQGNTALFYDKDMHRLFSYNMENCECRSIATFSGNEDLSFSKILCGSDSTVLYLADNTLGLFRYDLNNGSLVQVPGTDHPIVAQATIIDKNNVIWLSVPSQGIKGYHINSNYEKVSEYNKWNCNLISNEVSFITELPNSNLLLGHGENGSCIIEREKKEMSSVSINKIPSLKNITSTLVNPMDQETLFGTSGYGLISIKKTFINQIRHLNEYDEGILNYENYISIFEEPEGTVLLGVQDRGLCRINPITQEKSAFKETAHLTVTSMCRFDDNKILLSDPTNGFFLFNRSDGHITPLPPNHPIWGTLSDNKNNNICLASVQDKDIFIFNADSRNFVYHKEENILVEYGLQTDDGTLVKNIENFCITPYAIYVTFRGTILEIDFNTLISRTVYRNEDKIIHNITSIAANSKGELFFTEPEGLHRYNPRSYFDELLVETWGNGRFMNVTIDNRDRIWFTTTNEYLHLYDLSNRELLMYSIEDGVPDSRFQNAFSICTSSGIVLFPNASGMVTVNTNGSLMYDTPPVEVTCLSAQTDKKFIPKIDLDRSLLHPFRLPTKFQELTLEFSANSFNPTYPHLIIYNIYRDNALVMSFNTTNTTITIPKLDNGTYSVVTRQAYRKGLSEPITILRFRIPKPFLATIPGVLFLLLLMLAFGYSIARISSSMEKNRMEKALAAQDIKNREDKIAFLSNIAHELRTPLSIIYNPVKDMLEENAVTNTDHERLQRILIQVQKMTDMVNLILEKGTSNIPKTDIVIEKVDLNEWLGKIIDDFKIDIFAKGLKTLFLPTPRLGKVYMDVNMVETAVTNIMTNAIKYSDTGTITVSTGHDKGKIWIKFHDEGRGFTGKPEELFKRYYRENENVPGYGLGLSHAKDLINLLDGTIKAKKNSGPGSTFMIEIPDDLAERFQRAQSQPQIQIMAEQADFGNIEEPAQTEEVNFDTKSMTLLIVDDQDDILQFIRDEYSALFKTIYTAHDGKEALELIRQRMPNLVVSDIMMPRMNGFELCKTIKTDLELSSIPVILLTSRSDPKNQDMGYKMGADSFLPKPFDSKQLYKIIRSQLKNRFEIKRQYASSFFSAISKDQTFSAADEQFVLKLNRFIRENLSNTMLGVDMIIEHMNVSRTTLFNKMNNLVGVSTNKYIRRIRIDLAKEMLSKTNKSVGTIAEETGFSESQYFSTVFKQETGMTPSQFKDSLRKI